MDEAVNHNTTDDARGFLRRRFLKGVCGALLAVGIGVSLTGCPSTQSSDPNNEPPDIDPPEPDDENPPENPDENPNEPGGENPGEGPGGENPGEGPGGEGPGEGPGGDAGGGGGGE